MSHSNLDANGASSRCHVVAMPYPGRGHINPMMTLCRLLAARGVAVTFVVTEEWLGLLDSSTAPPPPPPGVRLRTIPNVIPSEKGRAADFSGFIEAVYTKMEDPVERLLDRLEPPATAIVADTYLPWAVAVGNRRNIPVISLFTMSASFFSVLYHFDRLPVAGDQPLPVDESYADEPLEQFFPWLASMRLADFGTLFSVRTLIQALEAFSWIRKAQCVLFTSFYEIEACVIDALRAELSCPVYPVGPSIPYRTLEEQPKKPILPNGCNKDHFDWLDSQPKNSVLYVSLGSFLSVSSSQMDEIAMGLRSSETRFFWVARGDSSRVQEMSGVMGLVVPWCDQLKVLHHPSIGGFLTHCGWNSTLEGVFTGVPMLTFPITWDQPPNSRLIVDQWKVGLSLKEKVRIDEVVGREEIAQTIKRLMKNTVESREMRRRAAELREASHRAIEEGGSSWTNFNSFVRDLLAGHNV